MRNINHPEQTPEKVYVLCEEHEDDYGFFSVSIHAISNDEDALKRLLHAKVEKDEHNLIAENGISDSSDTHIETNHASGYVKYYISEHNLLSRDQALALLNTKEYDVAFHHPDNLKDIVRADLATIMDTGQFYSYNADVAADYIMADKRFQSAVKQRWWSGHSHLEEDDVCFAETEVGVYLTNRLCEDQDWFVTIGAAERLPFPKNLKDILINSIYDHAKDYHLHIYDAQKTAEEIMRQNNFRAEFQSMCEAEYLPVESKEYEHAAYICSRYLKFNPLPNPKPSSFQSLIEDACDRQSKQPVAQSPAPDRNRL